MDPGHLFLILGGVLLAGGLHWRHVRASDRLRREEREHRAFATTLLDTISDGVAACDAQGRLVFFNRAAKGWHGLPQLNIPVAEMSERYDLFRADGITPLPSEENPLVRALAGKVVQDQELMICPPGLPRRRVLASAGPFHGPGLVRLGAVTTLRDVTEQFRAEQESRAAMQIIENSASILFKWRGDAAMTVEFVSRNVDQFGYSAEDFLSGRRNLDNVIQAEDLGRVRAEVADRIRQGRNNFFLHFRIFDASERIRWVDAWIHLVRDASGRVTHYHGIVTDATEREVIADMLRESEQRMELALNGAELGMWDWDIMSGQVIYNEQWIGMLGYDLREMRLDFRQFEELIHPDDRGPTLEILQGHLRGETDLYQTEFRMRHKEGRWIWIHVRGKVLQCDADGEPLRMAGTHQDITARKQAETERREFEDHMRRTQKLESLGVLAGGVAHDFNNILMAVLGNAELARLELPAEAPALEFLQEIEHASEQAADLCNQMLAYSGRGRIRVRDVELSRTVREITQMIGVGVSKKIELRYDLAEDLPPFRADISQIRQVIMNLITNANEAIGDQAGEIRITTRAAEGEEAGRGPDRLVLEVRDTGCGMDAETRDRLFEPFFTTKFTGRGLGMAAVAGIVRAHDGEIEIVSEPGRGTCIRITLPFSPSSTPEAVEEQPLRRNSPEESLLVLLVDDEDTVLRLGGRILESLGHRVITALDGVEAVAAVEGRGDIDCVLMDMTMPRMDGAEALSEMRRRRPGLPVVISSGYHADELAKKLEPGTPFIQKPYRRDELSGILDAATRPCRSLS